MADPVERQAIDDELFAYATGALDPARRARVAALIESDAAMRARFAWYEAVCDGVVASLPALENLPSADDIVGRIRGRAQRRGFFGWLAGPGLKPASTLAALLIIVQAAVISLLALERSETPAVRSGAPALGTIILVVAFDPEATESAIRALLLQAGATIIGGPKQLGEYRLAVPANRVEFATSLLMQSNIVEYVRPQER